MNWFLRWEASRHMVNIVQLLIDNLFKLKWLTGYRTYLLAAVQFILAGAYAINLGNLKAHLTPEQFGQIMALLAPATAIAAANHKPA